MTKVTPPPIQNPILDEAGNLSIMWTLFFNSIFTGDTGTNWTPTFTGLTQTGTPTITGTYYKLSQSLVYFTITITPSTDTSSIAGTTYIDNFPLDIKGAGACFALANNTGGGAGMANADESRIYTPVWTTIASPLTVVGICGI